MIKVEALETMVLKDNQEMQVVLNKSILNKSFSVTVINKKTQKQRHYKNTTLILNLIKDCIEETMV